jgi:hypothetical protein
MRDRRTQAPVLERIGRAGRSADKLIAHLV